MFDAANEFDTRGMNSIATKAIIANLNTGQIKGFA